jgi:TonB family protein
MRQTHGLPAILLLTAGVFTAVTLSAQQGVAPGSTESASAPTPDKNGVYTAGPGLDAPYLTSPAMAVWPSSADAAEPARLVRLTAVISADGTVQTLNVIQPNGSPYEQSAEDAVKQSKFAPGMLNGTAVPVLVCVRVPFFNLRPAIPRLQNCPQPGEHQLGGPPNPFRLPPGTTPPRATYAPNPEYSDQARRKKIQGTVLISLTVNEQGLPTDLHVERSLGYGLDENALGCVSQYRFQPARDRDGNPVAAHISVEVSYRLY